MRWQKEQMEPLGNTQGSALVPACLIHDQDKGFVRPNPLFLSEDCQCQGKGFRIDGGQKEPTGLAALRLDKAVQIHPLIARSNHCPNLSAFLGPHAAQDGLLAAMRCSSLPHSSTAASG